MNSMLETLDPLARLVVQAMLNSLWQGLLIAALAWVLLRALGRVSATTRHALWLVSLLTISLLPLAGVFFAYQRAETLARAESEARLRTSTVAVIQPQQGPPLLQLASTVRPSRLTPRPATIETLLPKPAEVEPLMLSVTPRETLADAPPIAATVPAKEGAVLSRSGWAVRLSPRFSGWFANWIDGRAPLYLAAFWLAASLLLSVRIAHSYLFLFRLRRRLEAVPEPLSQRKDFLATRFGIQREVGLCSAASIKMPMTIGWWRPLIVLPPDLPESLSSAECDSVIAHELAHIKRWDYATNFAQRVIQAVLFFHPAVWFINKQLVIERELACDDWAVKLTGEPRRYASCLTKLVELLSESKPLAAATGILFGKHIISRRVEMILNRDRNATTSVSKPALAYAIGLAFLFVFACSALSPVIAVPLTQKPAKKAPEAKPAKPVPATPRAEAPTTLPAELLDELPAPARIEFDGEEFVIPALPPMPALVELPNWANDAVIALQDQDMIGPRALVPPRAPEFPLAPMAWADALATTIPAPAYAPVAPYGLTGTLAAGQNATTQSKTPAIPEAELLSLLTDIVKKDSDENVRREALQGIYRMRNSDAAINSLIQLYDAVSDVKTKGEILNYLMRRNGDNNKAIAKLVQIAKNEKDENLMRAALNQLAYVKGDEGADHLISIYDGVQDPKLKQRVIRALAYNKSKKAVDKLMAIAKNDSDPTVRTAAIRSLYEIDNRLYLNFAEGTKQSLLTEPRLFTPRALTPRVEVDRLNERARDLNERMRFEFDGKKFELNNDQLNEALKKSKEALERARDLGKMHFEFDGKAFEWNQQQMLEFQNRAREAQQRAVEQMRELQERLRGEWRELEPGVYRVTPEAHPVPKPERDQQREERKSNKDQRSSEKPTPAPKPATYNAARI